MKKMVLLTLCLLLVASSALAGTMPVELQKLNEDQDLIYVIPEGVEDIETTDVNGTKLAVITLSDPAMPTYVMVISYSEILHDKSLEDLTDDEIHAVVTLTAEDSEEHSYTVVEMDDGRKAVLITYEGESDWVDAFTIISGYFIQIHGAHEDFSTLTETENEFAFTLLDSVDVVDSTE